MKLEHLFEFKYEGKFKYNEDEWKREHQEIERTILKNMSKFERILYKIGFKKLSVRKFRTDAQYIDDLKEQVKGFIKVIRVFKNDKQIHKFISVYKA